MVELRINFSHICTFSGIYGWVYGVYCVLLFSSTASFPLHTGRSMRGNVFSFQNFLIDTIRVLVCMPYEATSFIHAGPYTDIFIQPLRQVMARARVGRHVRRAISTLRVCTFTCIVLLSGDLSETVIIPWREMALRSCLTTTL